MSTPAMERATRPFELRMLDIINDAFLALMISVGHRTGLFDAMASLPPSTSEQIAAAAGLHERYVREWLGAMVTGRIVQYDPAGRYCLPEEHARVLTRAAGMSNMASFAQFVPMFGAIEDELVVCFRDGGGVPYDCYPRFQTVAGEGSREFFDATLLDVTLPLVPGLTERLAAGVDVADFGCGQGHAINVMARAFPNSRFCGYDLSPVGIDAARAEADEWGLTNARFELCNIEALQVRAAFDLVTMFDALHDQGRPISVLRVVHDALRPGGTVLIVDIAASSELSQNMDDPLGPAMYAFSCMHCMTVSLANGGEGPGTMVGREKIASFLAEAGFAHVSSQPLPGSLNSDVFWARRS